jgi:hypothetical protein
MVTGPVAGMAEAVPVAEASLGLFGSVCGVGQLRGGGALDGFAPPASSAWRPPGLMVSAALRATRASVSSSECMSVGGVGLGRGAGVVEGFHERGVLSEVQGAGLAPIGRWSFGTERLRRSRGASVAWLRLTV